MILGLAFHLWSFDASVLRRKGTNLRFFLSRATWRNQLLENTSLSSSRTFSRRFHTVYHHTTSRRWWMHSEGMAQTLRMYSGLIFERSFETERAASQIITATICSLSRLWIRNRGQWKHSEESPVSLPCIILLWYLLGSHSILGATCWTFMRSAPTWFLIHSPFWIWLCF